MGRPEHNWLDLVGDVTDATDTETSGEVIIVSCFRRARSIRPSW
jgi:hypothetical protein